MSLEAACRAWILRAAPHERARYLATGGRGPGAPVDLRPRSVRAADISRTLSRAPSTRRGSR